MRHWTATRRLSGASVSFAAISLVGLIAISAPPASAQILSEKRGFADTGASYGYLQAVNAGWYHRWGPSKSSTGGFDAKFVPMFWGGYQVNQSNIDMIINYGDVEWVLGFNEPERSSQANMSVSQAIAAWQTLDAGFDGTGIKLISPSVSDDGTGQSWLSSFMSQASSQGLQVDAVSFHWYGISNPNDPVGAAWSFLARVDWYHNSFGKPVWITEFALHDWGGNYSDEEMRAANATFLSVAIPQLESRSYVAGYAWYNWFGDSKLVEGSPLKPTNVGYEYVGVLEGGEYYDFGGDDLGEHVAYLGGGELACESSGGAVRYVNALNGTSTISGSVDWGLSGGSWVRIQPGATIRKTGTNLLTWNDIDVTNEGMLDVRDGELRIDGNSSVTSSGALRVAASATVSFYDMRRPSLECPVDLDGGTLSTDIASGFNVATGVTLVGDGAIVGGFSAQADTLIRIGSEGLPPLPSQFVIDDFESYALGLVRDVASPPWTAHGGGTGTMFASIVDDGSGSNNTMAFGWTDNFRGVSRPLPEAAVIENADLATVFFRIYCRTDSPDHNLGVCDVVDTDSENFGNFEAQLRLYPDSDPSAGTYGLDARDGGAFVDLVDSLSTNTWYNVWLTIDQTTDTYDVYLNSGTADASAGDKLNSTPLSFRNGTTDPLNVFLALAGAAPLDYAVRVDDLSFLTGADLTNPLGGLNPVIHYEPATLAVDGDATFYSGATLELGVANSGACDQLAATGQIAAGGTLDVQFSPGVPLPQGGDAFQVLSAASINGAFEAVALDALAPGDLWDLRELYAAGVISVLSAGDALTDSLVCLAGPDTLTPGGCEPQDQDADADNDMHDFAMMQACVTNASGVLEDGCLAE